MTFDEIAGRRELKDALKNAVGSGRVGHAYVFTGPAGVGKKTIAGIFSGILLCRDTRDGEACGECPSCLMYAGGSNPDFSRVEAEDASIGVEQIRELQGDVAVRPMYAARKVYLICDADKMTVQAQNCMLKTLEEPPPYAVIILTASSYEALLETIRSRAARFDVKRNSREEVSGFLHSRFGKSLEGMEFILSYSDGIIGRALELVENGRFAPMREAVFSMLSKTGRMDMAETLKLYGLFEEYRDDVGDMLDIMLSYYRDLLVAGRSGKENLLINSDKKDIILGNALSFNERRILKSVEAIEAARMNIKKNVNFQLTVEVMLMKLQEV